MLLEAAMVDDEVKEPPYGCAHESNIRLSLHGDSYCGTRGHAPSEYRKPTSTTYASRPSPAPSSNLASPPRFFFTPPSNLLTSGVHGIADPHPDDRFLNTMAYSSVASLSPYYFSPVSTCSSIVTTANTNAAALHDIVPSPPFRSSAPHSVTPSRPTVLASDADIDTPDVISIQASANTTPSEGKKTPHPMSTSASSLTLTTTNLGHHGKDFMPSFVNPDLEVQLDDVGANTASHTSKSETRIGMADFIRRGGPGLMRSFSATNSPMARRSSGIGTFSRISSSLAQAGSSPFSQHSSSLHVKPTMNSKLYHSAHLVNGRASANTSPVRMSDRLSLDELFPLKRPNETWMQKPKLVRTKVALMASHNVDANTANPINTSIANLGHANKAGATDRSRTMSTDNSLPDRPPQELIFQENDDNAFVYSPIASAFVFSPRRSARASNKNLYFNRISSEAHNMHHDVDSPTSAQPLKSILKKTRTMDCSGQVDSVAPHLLSSDTDDQKDHLYSVSNVSAPKISSVLLRLIEAEEQLLNASRKHAGSTAHLPTCSFLGKALLCRSKLPTHGDLHE